MFFYVKCWMEPDLQFIKATSLATLMGTGGARCWLRSWGQPQLTALCGLVAVIQSKQRGFWMGLCSVPLIWLNHYTPKLIKRCLPALNIPFFWQSSMWPCMCMQGQTEFCFPFIVFKPLSSTLLADALSNERKWIIFNK